MLHRLVILPAVIALFFSAGCAPKNWDSEQDGPFDPLENINRSVYKFNSGLDFILFKPTATVYEKFPGPVKTGIGNVFSNLAEPGNVVNNALQNEGEASVTSAARFIINSVFGVGGMIDVAEMWDIPKQEADFGQTLRSYGMQDTAYLVLPVVGSSTFADSIGRGVDILLRPQTYIKDAGTRNILTAVNAVHIRAELLPLTRLAEEAALDEYLFIRDSYEQNRRSKVKSTLKGR